MTSTMRPQLWTFLFFAILCRVLIADASRARRWLPLLFAAWANNHGGWIVGIGVLGVWAAGRVLADRRTFRSWAVLVAACALATLATPYGWHLWRFVLQTVRPERAIAEWQPLWTTDWINLLPWATAVGTAAFAMRRPVQHRIAIAGVLAMLAYGSLRVLRIESLFIEAAAVLLAGSFRAWWPARSRPLQRTTPAAEWSIAAAAFAVTTAGSVWLLSSTLRCLPTQAARAADREAVLRLQTAQPGRLVTYFDWGEYAIWHLYPRLRVSMDGRRETVYSDARIAEHDGIVDGTPAGFEMLSVWRAECVWLPATSRPTMEWLAANGYRIEMQSPRSFVAVRQDLPPLEPPGQQVDEGACFPQ